MAIALFDAFMGLPFYGVAGGCKKLFCNDTG